MHSYIAACDLTLSDPYQFIAEGSRVDSRKPLDNEHLIPLEEYVPPTEKPLMGSMIKAGSEVERVLVAPIMEDSNYQAQIRQLQAMERADGIGAPTGGGVSRTEEDDGESDAPIVTPKPKPKGTGSTNVLA